MEVTDAEPSPSQSQRHRSELRLRVCLDQMARLAPADRVAPGSDPKHGAHLRHLPRAPGHNHTRSTQPDEPSMTDVPNVQVDHRINFTNVLTEVSISQLLVLANAALNELDMRKLFEVFHEAGIEVDFHMRDKRAPDDCQPTGSS
jgi:hypothetical protein